MPTEISIFKYKVKNKDPPQNKGKEGQCFSFCEKRRERGRTKSKIWDQSTGAWPTIAGLAQPNNLIGFVQ